MVLLQTSKQFKNVLARLKEIEKMEEDGTFNVLPKKEVVQLKKEYERLVKFLVVFMTCTIYQMQCS